MGISNTASLFTAAANILCTMVDSPVVVAFVFPVAADVFSVSIAPPIVAMVDSPVFVVLVSPVNTAVVYAIVAVSIVLSMGSAVNAVFCAAAFLDIRLLD